MTKAKQKIDPSTVQLDAVPGKTPEQLRASATLMPSLNAASVIQAYLGNVLGKDVDMTTLVKELRSTCDEVKFGDLHNLEAMLLAQATALQTIFTSLARRSQVQEYQKNLESFLGLALKAQAQSRATISALVELKYPRQATFVKQANIAHGPQQVNNGTATARPFTHAEENKTDQNKLLEDKIHERTHLDSGATPAAKRSHQTVEAVGNVNRAKKPRG